MYPKSRMKTVTPEEFAGSPCTGSEAKPMESCRKLPNISSSQLVPVIFYHFAAQDSRLSVSGAHTQTPKVAL